MTGVQTCALPISEPVRTVNTKHAGQQGLVVRDDDKIFATAGWDARLRVYSVKTMQELAVLKWHKEGCHCVTFAATILRTQPSAGAEVSLPASQALKPATSALVQIKHNRTNKSQHTHWLAAGGKDGKVTLWDIY